MLYIRRVQFIFNNISRLHSPWSYLFTFSYYLPLLPFFFLWFNTNHSQSTNMKTNKNYEGLINLIWRCLISNVVFCIANMEYIQKIVFIIKCDWKLKCLSVGTSSSIFLVWSCNSKFFWSHYWHWFCWAFIIERIVWVGTILCKVISRAKLYIHT